jgi:hypothetical protein
VTITAAQHTPRSTAATGWAPFALIALALIPAVFGTLRLVELAGGPALMPANPRLNASPVPVIVHIVSAVGYTVLGAFQFSTGLRRRRPGWRGALRLQRTVRDERRSDPLLGNQLRDAGSTGLDDGKLRRRDPGDGLQGHRQVRREALGDDDRDEVDVPESDRAGVPPPR